MKNLFLYCCLALLMFASTSIQNISEVTAGAKNQNYFIDILYLKKGKTVADAEFYFNKVEKVVARHGLKRAKPAFSITKSLTSKDAPHLVNVWFISDPEGTFPNIMSDPAYKKNIPLRNATFDMSRAQMFMMKKAFDKH